MLDRHWEEPLFIPNASSGPERGEGTVLERAMKEPEKGPLASLGPDTVAVTDTHVVTNTHAG